TFALSISLMTVNVFFFSSGRRHTRFSRDWSSDVCSSDLFELAHCMPDSGPTARTKSRIDYASCFSSGCVLSDLHLSAPGCAWRRSEERRVGKECRFRVEDIREKI